MQPTESGGRILEGDEINAVKSILFNQVTSPAEADSFISRFDRRISSVNDQLLDHYGYLRRFEPGLTTHQLLLRAREEALNDNVQFTPVLEITADEADYAIGSLRAQLHSGVLQHRATKRLLKEFLATAPAPSETQASVQHGWRALLHRLIVRR